MEPLLAVTVTAPVASFRRPLDHNFQRTLPMPAPTTLIGIAGAALGLSDRQLWNKKQGLLDLKVSVYLEELPGKARDMWTVLKIKQGKIAERSPYFRELLFQVRYVLLYGGPEQRLRELARAFENPVYPLSLGRDDEMLLIEELALGQARPGESLFEGTVLPGDLRTNQNYRARLNAGNAFEPPLVERLPTVFEIDKKGIRHPRQFAFFSFLPLGVTLEIAGVTSVQWKGRNFVWLNSSPNPMEQH